MAFIYNGNHASTHLYGHDFPRGEPVELDEKRLPVGLTLEFVKGKLSNNSHFDAVEDAIDGELDEERAELLEKAEALGLKIHPRTKTETIRKKIEEVE